MSGPNKARKMKLNAICNEIKQNLGSAVAQIDAITPIDNIRTNRLRSQELVYEVREELLKLEGMMGEELLYKRNLKNPILAPSCYERLSGINSLYAIYFLDKYLTATERLEECYRLSPFKNLFQKEEFYENLCDMDGFYAKLFLEKVIEFCILNQLQKYGLNILTYPDNLQDVFQESGLGGLNPRIKYVFLEIKGHKPIKLPLNELSFKELADQLEYSDKRPEELSDILSSELCKNRLDPSQSNKCCGGP